MSIQKSKAAASFLNSDPQGTRNLNTKTLGKVSASAIACKSTTQVIASFKIEHSVERSRKVTTKRHLRWHSPVSKTTPYVETFQMTRKEVQGIVLYGNDRASRASRNNRNTHIGTSESQRSERSFLGEGKRSSICSKKDLLDSRNVDSYRTNCNKRSESRFYAAAFSHKYKKRFLRRQF